MMNCALICALLKVLCTFACYFLYNRLLPATFPSVLYIYVFFFSLFTGKMATALAWLPYLFIGAALPSVGAALVMWRNQKGAGVAAFFLMLLCLADMLFILVNGWTYDLVFTTFAMLLNLATVVFLILMHNQKA